MQNKIFKNLIGTFLMFGFLTCSVNSFADEIPAEEIVVDENGMVAEDESANAVSEYNPDGSLFQQITDLEQEKVLMKLEKERAELDLEMDRLAAEKIKLNMELDDLSKEKENQKQELAQKEQELKSEAAKLEQQKQSLSQGVVTSVAKGAENKPIPTTFSKKYKLIDIIGSGKELQSTIQDLTTGQRKKIAVGKTVDDYTVTSISLYDGVVFENGDSKEILNIIKSE